MNATDVQVLRNLADMIDVDGAPEKGQVVRAAADELERLRERIAKARRCWVSCGGELLETLPPGAATEWPDYLPVLVIDEVLPADQHPGGCWPPNE